ncbi:MAG: Trm112 family protein [Thiohalorhabdus sp.]|uniref:Trm112 family protein n=1 Tax=Thiohalorhabdus sp. TaxID=3094134 RepID=UPI003980BB95
MLDRKLLDILVCPVCKAEVELNREKNGLVCHKCKLEYPIQDDIPVMLPDEARSLEAGAEEKD